MWQWRYNNYNELYHYGVKGMRWGHRKNPTKIGLLGMRRRQSSAYANMTNSRNAYADVRSQAKAQMKSAKAAYKEAKKAERNSPEAKAERKAKAKRAMTIGASVAAAALATYGTYKLSKYINSSVRSKHEAIQAKRGYEEAERMFDIRAKAALSGPGKVTKLSLSSNSGQAAAQARARAQNDSFRTALKNVSNYKKANGKDSLRWLESAADYERKNRYWSFG